MQHKSTGWQWETEQPVLSDMQKDIKMTKRAIYLECASGISGDMTAAALLDLGADEETLRKALGSLPVSGYEIKISRVKKSGIDACDFDVILEHDNHDHDMEYLHGHDHGPLEAHVHEHSHDHGPDEAHLHGHEEEHDHKHSHDHEPGEAHLHGHGEEHGHEHSHDHGSGEAHLHGHGEEHGHEHSHDHGSGEAHLHEHEEEHSHGHEHGHDHTHPHEHRGLREISAIIDGGHLTENARELAHRIFRIIARGEAKAHNVPEDQVHFHEVGAVDSIVDVVAAAVCLDSLGVADVIVSPLTEGTGTGRCQHGILPIPVPAVANIAAAEKLEMHISSVRGELVTPTGAAIAAAFRTSERLPEHFHIIKTGIGAGKRTYECPGILRAMLIEYEENEERESCAEDSILCLETNIDDCGGELLGETLRLLMDAGARDAFFQPVFMKKNRPGWLLKVICDDDRRTAMEDIIFRGTTTIGIRRTRVQRTVLERSQEKVHTSLGDAVVKKCSYNGFCRCYPEYESAAELSRKTGLPLYEVFAEIRKACE